MCRRGPGSRRGPRWWSGRAGGRRSRRCWGCGREAGSVPSVSDDPASLERLLATSEDALLVAEADGRVVGTIIAGWDGWRANFYRLAVLPSARRRGIALQLVNEAERRLAAKGARRLSAIVMSEHDPAVALWLAAGYTHDTRVGRYVRTLP